MILADTSLWIQHFRHGLPDFEMALRKGKIATHSFVIGELAMGNLSRRSNTLAALRQLPRASEGTIDECHAFVEAHKLHGRGIGWGDLQLIVAARLSGYPLWTLDTRLAAAVVEQRIAYFAS